MTQEWQHFLKGDLDCKAPQTYQIAFQTSKMMERRRRSKTSFHRMEIESQEHQSSNAEKDDLGEHCKQVVHVTGHVTN